MKHLRDADGLVHLSVLGEVSTCGRDFQTDPRLFHVPGINWGDLRASLVAPDTATTCLRCMTYWWSLLHARS